MVDDSKINEILHGIDDKYYLSLLTLLPPVLVITLAVIRVGGLAVMVIATVVAVLIALLLQGATAADILGYLNYGYKSSVGI